VGVELDGCVPEACGQRVHVVGYAVAFCVWGGGVAGEVFVRGVFGVEADEEDVVVEMGDGCREGDGAGKVRYVVEGCGCV